MTRQSRFGLVNLFADKLAKKYRELPLVKHRLIEKSVFANQNWLRRKKSQKNFFEQSTDALP